MAHRGGGDPGVVAAQATTAVALRRRDAGEAAGDLRVDGQQRVGGLDARQGGEADRSYFLGSSDLSVVELVAADIGQLFEQGSVGSGLAGDLTQL